MLRTSEANQHRFTIVEEMLLSVDWNENCKVVAVMLEKKMATVAKSMKEFRKWPCFFISVSRPDCGTVHINSVSFADFGSTLALLDTLRAQHVSNQIQHGLVVMHEARFVSRYQRDFHVSDVISEDVASFHPKHSLGSEDV